MSNVQQTHYDTRGARKMAKNSGPQDREERRAETTAHNLLAAEFSPEFEQPTITAELGGVRESRAEMTRRVHRPCLKQRA